MRARRTSAEPVAASIPDRFHSSPRRQFCNKSSFVTNSQSFATNPSTFGNDLGSLKRRLCYCNHECCAGCAFRWSTHLAPKSALPWIIRIDEARVQYRAIESFRRKLRTNSSSGATRKTSTINLRACSRKSDWSRWTTDNPNSKASS